MLIFLPELSKQPQQIDDAKYFNHSGAPPIGRIVKRIQPTLSGGHYQNSTRCSARHETGPKSQLNWQNVVCDLRNLRWLHQRFGSVAEPYAVDSQSQGTSFENLIFSPITNSLTLVFFSDPSKDDLQPATVELSEVPVPIFHRSGPRTSSSGQSWPGDQLHAGGRQQGQGCRSMSCLWTGKSIFECLSVCRNRVDHVYCGASPDLLRHGAMQYHHVPTYLPTYYYLQCEKQQQQQQIALIYFSSSRPHAVKSSSQANGDAVMMPLLRPSKFLKFFVLGEESAGDG